MKSRAILVFLAATLIACHATVAHSLNDQAIEGEIAKYECGDNCYLTIRSDTGKEHTGLCTARQCQSWNANAAMPGQFVGRAVRATIGTGDQLDGNGGLVNRMDAFTTIQFLKERTTTRRNERNEGAAGSGLRFTPLENVPIIVVAGDFDNSDDLAPFVAMVRKHSTKIVAFNSRGGNPYKAMELGRVIRRLGLSTMQLKQFNCESACSLAFLGGVIRIADAGSIGIHKSSLSRNAKLDAKQAISVVQSLMAATMSYTTEMGADPTLIEIALKYDADDMRYLSKSEMRRLRVTTADEPSEPPRVADTEGYKSATPAPTLANPRDERPAPKALSGRIRHPKGASPLKLAGDITSADVATLKNGTPVSIVGTEPNWYRVKVAGNVGYLHHTWVAVDQFLQTSDFDHRFIQVRSFSSYPTAEQYVKSSPLKLAIFRATNGWYAIALRQSADYDRASELLRGLKAEGKVPPDSFLSFGNTYTQKVCCEEK